MDEITGKFTQYEEKTAEGNYLEAREIVLSINGILERIKNDMDLIPDLLVECHSTIPSQLSELKEGNSEMINQGYILDHIEVEKETERISQELALCMERVEKADVEGIPEQIDEWKDCIDQSV